MDEPWGPYAKRNKPGTKGQIQHDCTYMRHLIESNSQKQRVEWWLPGAWGRGNGDKKIKVYRFSVIR